MNGEAQQAGRMGKQKVSRPVYKFLIGFIGGFCAAIFPRLMAALALFDSSDVVLISAGYLGIAVIFAALIGAVVMIMEWGVSKEPSATFMTALGLPALLAGALNTSNGAYVLDSKAKETKQLADTVQMLSAIPEITIDELKPVGDAGDMINFPEALTFGIGTAYAADGSNSQEGFDLNPSMQTKQQQYYIVLVPSVSGEADAKKKAKHLRTTVPGAKAVKAGERYLVIDSMAKPKSEAVLEAIRLKQKGLQPALIPVK